MECTDREISDCVPVSFLPSKRCDEKGCEVSIKDILDGQVKLTQHLVKILSYQLLQGVLVLQFANVIHRDLKPSALFLYIMLFPEISGFSN